MASNNLRGTSLALLSGTMFGLLGYLGTKLVDHHFSIENMLFWRFMIASCWMISVILITQPYDFITALKHNALMKIFVLGGLSYSGASAFYFLSSALIGTGPAMVIFYSFPVFVAVFGLFAGTWRVDRFAATALIAVLIGLLLLKGQGSQSMNIWGVSFGLVAALCYAAYVYGSKRTLQNLNSAFLTLIVCVGNTLIFLALSLYRGSFQFPRSVHDWLYICAIGVVATALPIQLLLDGLKYISPVKASVISIIEPVITVILGLVLLHESVSATQTMGILIVLIGALLIQFERSTDEA